MRSRLIHVIEFEFSSRCPGLISSRLNLYLKSSYLSHWSESIPNIFRLNVMLGLALIRVNRRTRESNC